MAPATGDRIVGGIGAGEIRRVVRPGDAAHAPHARRQRPADAVHVRADRREPAVVAQEQNARVEEQPRPRGARPDGAVQLRVRRAHERVQRHRVGVRMPMRTRVRREGRDAVIRRQHDEEVLPAVTIDQPAEKPVEVAVEPQHLVVDLAGVGAERVAHRVGCRQADGEQVGGAAAAQLQRFDAAQGERERERIHQGSALEGRGRVRAVQRQRVREGHAAPGVLPRLIVDLGVRRVREQQRPFPTGGFEG